jgi:hypothetical protein
VDNRIKLYDAMLAFFARHIGTGNSQDSSSKAK